MIPLDVVYFYFTRNHNRIAGIQRQQNFFLVPLGGGVELGKGIHLTLVVIIHLNALHDQPVFLDIQLRQQQKTGGKLGDGGQRARMQAPDVIEVAPAIRDLRLQVVRRNLDHLKPMGFVEGNHTG